MLTLSSLAFDKTNLLKCQGYNSKYIDARTNVSLATVLKNEFHDHLPEVEGCKDGTLRYTDFSVLYHAKRKVPFVVAYNINGADKADQPKRPKFRGDPRIPPEIQLDEDFYDLRTDKTEFEIGHMASNNEMGRGKNGQVKAYQTFHFTNSVPQAEALNTGLWKGLESYVIKEAATIKRNKKICVFTGPVLNEDDPPYVMDTTFRIPLLFYKVIVFLTPSGIYSTAFMMSHERRMLEDNMFAVERPTRITRGRKPEIIGYFDDFPYSEVFQVNIPFVEKYTKLRFSWKGVKPVKVPQSKLLIQNISKINNAKDAKELMKKKVRRGVEFGLAEKKVVDPTKQLNMILP